MQITVHEWTYEVGIKLLGQDLNSSRGRRTLKTRFLTSEPHSTSEMEVSGLQPFIDVYADQVTVDAVEDLRKYLNYVNRLGQLTGPEISDGMESGPHRPSLTAITVIGQGLVGWYLEQQPEVNLISMLNAEGPDFTFNKGATGYSRMVHAFVHATQQGSVAQQVRDTVVSSLQFARNEWTAGNAHSAVMFGVVIRSPEKFDLLKLRIDLKEA